MEEINQLCLNAAKQHHRLMPHIYSNAVKSYQTGFPYAMTPLPLVFTEDPNVYGLADTSRRMYQWMIGESLPRSTIIWRRLSVRFFPRYLFA